MTSKGGEVLRSFALCGLMVMMSGLASAQTGGFYSRNNPFAVEDLPEGPLKSQIHELTPKAKAKAMDKLHTLNFSVQDAAKSLKVTQTGDIYYACSMGHEGCGGSLTHDHGTEVIQEAVTQERTAAMQAPETDDDLTLVERSGSAAAPVPISSVPAYNSLPGAEYHIYLDFNGAVVEGTSWNSVAKPSFDCLPYDLDDDPTTFSDTEQESIRRIWERISEHYAPFAVNVTTDVTYDPDNYNSDRSKVAWALFTAREDANGVACPHEGRGGVAFVDVFGRADYQLSQPAWCLDAEAPLAALIGSHEIGHNLGLNHDGSSAQDLISGFTSTPEAPSWIPIMGMGTADVSQWSKGEYHDSNNQQDDLAIIASKIPLRADDHGGTFSLATPLAAGSTVNQKGIVERTGDIDVFRFEAAAGQLELEALPYRDALEGNGGNLDVVLEIYDSGGQLVAVDDTPGQTDSSISTTIAAGTYYALLKPTGAGDPLATSLPSGYTVYGSLGQYTLKGSYPIAPALLAVLAPAASDPVVAGSPFEITWEPSGVTGNVKLELYLGGGLHSVLATDEANDGSYSWTVPAGLTLGSGYAIRISSVDDPSIVSLGESFTVSEPGASALANALDAPDLDWSTEGDALWFSQSAETFDGVDAAESGFIPNGFYFEPAVSSLITTVQGPGTLTFRWKVDSLNNHRLSFHINDAVQEQISGATDWVLRTYTIPAGAQTLRWTYSKNFQQGVGQDSGWVDQVSYTADGGQALVVEQPAGTPLVSGSSTIDFGEVALGATSPTKTFTLRNDGIGDLSDISVAVMGEHGADFTAGALAMTTLAPGASTTVDLSFSPSEAFERNAYLAIFSSDFGNSPFIVNLVGDTPDLGRLDVQEVGNFFSSGKLGSVNFDPSSRVYSLRNTGGQNMNWEVTSTAPWIRLPTASGTLAPNQLALVTIEIDETVASAITSYGDYSGMLHFTNTGDGRGDTVRYAFLSITKDDQAISFDEISGPVAIGDGSISLSASSSSGLPVSFASSDTNVATVSGNTLTITGEGSVVITATQAGDGQYAPAAPVTRELAVLRSGQTPAVVYEPFEDGDISLAGNAPGEGLTGVWSGSATVTAGSLNFGNLTTGSGNRAAVDDRHAYINTGTALADSGLLADGATLWFSAVVETGGGLFSHSGELGFAFGTDQINPGTDLQIVNNGRALGFTFYKNRLRAVGWTPSLFRTQDITTPADALNSYLVVGKIVWGSNKETIEIYLPSSGLVPGDPVSSYSTSVNLDQTTFDMISFGSTSSNPEHEIDEIRFGGTYESVVDFRVLTGYEVWATGTFANPFTETDPTANPDQDQFNNLQEYAFGTDPTSPVMSQLSYVADGEVDPGAPMIENPGSGVEAGDFSIVFSRRKNFAASGLTYSALFSADLQAWEEHSVIATVVESSDPDFEVVKITFPSSVPLQSGGSVPPQFVRIGVE